MPPLKPKNTRYALIADAASEGYYPQFDSVLLVEKNEKAFTPLVNGNFDVDPFGEKTVVGINLLNCLVHGPVIILIGISTALTLQIVNLFILLLTPKNGDGYIYQDVTLVSDLNMF